MMCYYRDKQLLRFGINLFGGYTQGILIDRSVTDVCHKSRGLDLDSKAKRIR
jgi:hypothetical protein